MCIRDRPYITHCLAVACILTDMGMDSASVCAGLLHDVVEDTEITVEEISQRFGPDIALMVDGVTTVSYTHLDVYKRQC